MSQYAWQPDRAAYAGRWWPRRLCAVPRRPTALIHIVRSAAALATRAYLRMYHRLEIAGGGNLPADGSFVMVANHTSHLDGLCMLTALPLHRLDRAYPAAADDYFFVSLPRIAASTIFINAMPFGRREHVRESIDIARRLLRERGNVLILFPEGTRSTSGEMGEFRPGIGSVVAGLDVPVVPCAIRGAQQAMPKGSGFPRPRKICLSIGRPRNYAAMGRGKDAARQVSRELNDAVRELLCACTSTR